MKLFAQIRKVDEAQRLVYGRAAQEVVDKADEVMDYESSKPLFQKWSEEVSNDTDGKSLGNVRAMHGKVAAGKLTSIDFNDAEKAIDVCAKVVDDGEWKKVLEGVYTGFSIGGNYVGAPKVEKMDGRDVKRYTAAPNEVSLVDRPCIPTAKFFQVCKADGSTADVAFQEPPVEAAAAAAAAEPSEHVADGTVQGTPEEVDELCKAMNAAGLTLRQVIEKVAARDDVSDADKKAAKDKYGDVAYADEKNKKYPLDTAEHVRAAASYFGKQANRDKYSEDDQKAIDAKVAAAKKKFDIGDDAEKADFVLPLRKGLYTCGTLARLLQEVEYICRSVEYEAEAEGDGSPLGDQLISWLGEGGKLLQAMVAEEVAEATGGTDVDMLAPVVTDAIALSERAGALTKSLEAPLQKIGARNSAADAKRIQEMHDKSVELGANCGQADKSQAARDLEKIEQARTDELSKLVADAVAPLQKALETAQAEIGALKAQPAAPRVMLRAVAKVDDLPVEHQQAAQQPQPVTDSRGETHEAATLIKSLHKSGGAPLAAPLRK